MKQYRYCSNCGNHINMNAAYCPVCGTRVTAGTVTIIEDLHWKNKWVAFFLCLFLGYTGAHKFYESKVLLGFVYLFTCGLFGIGWIIDLISILFKPNPYAP